MLFSIQSSALFRQFHGSGLQQGTRYITAVVFTSLERLQVYEVGFFCDMRQARTWKWLERVFGWELNER